jgi:hypothetical protein
MQATVGQDFLFKNEITLKLKGVLVELTLFCHCLLRSQKYNRY